MLPVCFRHLGHLVLLFPVGTALAQSPTITAQLPLANAIAAGAASPLTISFSQQLAAASAGALKVFSSEAGGLRTQPAAVAVSGNMLRFAPTVPFRPGETVMSTVTTAAASSGGALAQPRVSQFTVAVGGTGRGSFIAPTTNPDPSVGTNPSGVVVGDVDGDGDLDLLSSSYVSATVSLRLNNGRGSFTAPAANPEIAVGATPAGVALGDIDGDGDLDLLAGNVNGSSVSVRLNNGAGVFSGGSNVAVGDYPSSLAVGDVDGDGDLDLVVTNFNNATVSVRLNNGSGGFTASAPTISVGNRPNSIALGDLDGDGDLDFVTANDNSGTLSVRFNNGSGSFIAGAAANLPMGSYPQSAVLGDLDGDGDLDVASVDLSGNAVRVRFNDGVGSFTARAATPDAAVGSSPKAVVLGDLDGDGDLDMLVVGATGSVTTRLNNGSGSFTTPALGTVAVGMGSGTIAAGDLDGDGDLDLVTTGAVANTVSVRLNGGTVLATRAGQPTVEVSCWPNPTHGVVSVQVPVSAQEAILQLRDAVGRVVRTQRFVGAGRTAEIELAGLVPGFYHVQVQAGETVFTGRLLVE
jgi:hypothetical protein